MVSITSIQLTKETKERLEALKIGRRSTFNEVIEDLLEDVSEINLETKKELAKAREEYKKGKWVSHEVLAEELGFSNV